MQRVRLLRTIIKEPARERQAPLGRECTSIYEIFSFRLYVNQMIFEDVTKTPLTELPQKKLRKVQY